MYSVQYKTIQYIKNTFQDIPYDNYIGYETLANTVKPTK